MSVINDMLRDLNHRQAPEVAEGRSGIPQSLIEPQKNTFKTLLFVLIFIVLIAGITVYWFAHLSDSLPTETTLAKQNETLGEALSTEVLALTEQTRLPEQHPVPEQKTVSEQKTVPKQKRVPEKTLLAEVAVKTDTSSASAKPLARKQHSATETSVAPEKTDVAETIISEPVKIEAVEVAKPSKPAIVVEKTPVEASAKQTQTIEPSNTENDSPVPQPSMQVSLSPNARDQQMAEQALNLFTRGKEAQAYRELVAFIAEQEVDTESRGALANYLIQENRLAEAGDVLLNAPIEESASLRQLKARWYAAQGDDKMALYTLNSKLPDIQRYPDYYVLLAAYYQQFGWHKEAIQSYNALLEYDDAVADWWAGLGLAADRNKDLKQALLAYQQAIELPGLAPELASFITSRLKQLQRARLNP